MKYILHDTSSMDDEKLTEVFMKFGYEGTGLFWAILEKIGKQEKPVKTEVLKKQLRVGKKLEKVWSFLEEIGVISSNNGETFNKQLLNYAETYKIKKEKNAKRISEWRENQQVKENVTHSESVSNAPKVKESKVKRKEINLQADALRLFEIFWDAYGKKEDRKKSEAKWSGMTDEQREKAIKAASVYVKRKPDPQYRKNPLTWLNGECWNDDPPPPNANGRPAYVMTEKDFYNQNDWIAYQRKQASA